MTDRTNSPAQKPAARKKRSSAMDMFHTAHTETRNEQTAQADAAYVRTIHHNAARQQQRQQEERRQEEEQNAQYAQKIQLEEQDGAFAEHLHELETKRMEENAVQRRMDEKRSEEMVRTLHAKEERESALAAKAMHKLATKDAKLARQVHKKMGKQLKMEENLQKKEELQRIANDKKSEQMARNLHARQERELEREKKDIRRRATKDEKMARKFHQNELSCVKREEMEEQRKIAVEKKEQIQKEKMNVKSQAIAQRLQEEEHRAFMKACEDRQQQHEDDERMARQMQGEELGEVATKGHSVREAWSNPEVEVEETKSGAVITVQLPNVRRMEVDLDEEENTIFVNAIPKSADRVVAKLTDDDTHAELKKIVEHQFVGALKPVAFEIKLDEIVEGLVTADDIVSEYVAETGLLRLELCGVVAKSKVALEVAKTSLLSRLGRLFKPSFARRKSQHSKK